MNEEGESSVCKACNQGMEERQSIKNKSVCKYKVKIKAGQYHRMKERKKVSVSYTFEGSQRRAVLQEYSER